MYNLDDKKEQKKKRKPEESLYKGKWIKKSRVTGDTPKANVINASNPIKCYNCGKIGHKSPDCRFPKRPGSFGPRKQPLHVAAVVQEGDDEYEFVVDSDDDSDYVNEEE